MSSKTFAQPVEPGSYYRLSNLLLQDGRALDIDSTTSELVMGIKADKPSQYWKFSPSGGGYYRITNVSLGDEQALDTQPDDDGDGVSDLQMGRKGDASGQYWQLVPVSGGYLRLTNQYLDKSSLTTLDDAPANASAGPPFNHPYMAITQRASSAQTWKLTKVTPSTSTTTTPATATTTPATATTTPATATTTPATTTITPATATTTPATTTITPATATTTPATATTTPATTTTTPATATSSTSATTSTSRTTTTAAATTTLQPEFTNLFDGDYFDPNSFKLEGETRPNASVSIQITYIPQASSSGGQTSSSGRRDSLTQRVGDAVSTLLGGSRPSSSSSSSTQQETQAYATTVKADASGRFQIVIPASIRQKPGTKFTIRATAIEARSNRSNPTVITVVQQ
ncbi:MAG: RICIN domain-containing protein [Microcoleus sp. SIO2G3]|nr:RICIN domain-containing protein [Microcoleus sp. SIO2G3]